MKWSIGRFTMMLSSGIGANLILYIFLMFGYNSSVKPRVEITLFKCYFNISHTNLIDDHFLARIMNNKLKSQIENLLNLNGKKSTKEFPVDKSFYDKYGSRLLMGYAVFYVHKRFP